MAKIVAADKPQLTLQMTAMETSTPAHCDQWNTRHQQLLNNDKYLSEQIKETIKNTGEKLDKSAIIDDLDTALSVTEDKVPVGCKAIQELNSNLSERINSGLSSKSSDWELIGKECGATLIHEKLKTCKEILIYGGYGQIVVSAPSELFELDGGIGYSITLPANGTWYSNYSQFFLDRSAGKLVSAFIYGANYTQPSSMRRVYVKI